MTTTQRITTINQPTNDETAQNTTINILQVLENTSCFNPNPEKAEKALTHFLTGATDIAQGIQTESLNDAELGMIVEKPADASLLAMGILVKTLDLSFPPNQYPYHNKHHSIGVASRALVLANEAAKIDEQELTEKDAISIILTALGHDIEQASDIQTYQEDNRNITEKIKNKKQLDPKAMIKRNTGNNEVNSHITLTNLLNRIKIRETNETLGEHLGQQETQEAAILGTTPKIEFTTIPGTKTLGLSISQPNLEEAVEKYVDGGSFLPVAIMLSDLSYGFGSGSEKKVLKNGMNEFMELHQNIGAVNNILQEMPNITEKELSNILAKDNNPDTIINQVVNWMNGQSAITLFQKHYMQQVQANLRTKNKVALANKLNEMTPNYDRNAKYAEEQTAKLQQELHQMEKNGGTSIQQLKLAFQYVGY